MRNMFRREFCFQTGLVLLLTWVDVILCQDALTVLNCPDYVCDRPGSQDETFVPVMLDEEPTLQNGTVLVRRTPIIFFEVDAGPHLAIYEFNGIPLCNFTIEVSSRCPALENCPSDIEIGPNRYIDSSSNIFVQWTEPIPARGFRPSSVVRSLDLPQAFVGHGDSVNISYDFTDVQDRQISCTFSVTVLDVDIVSPVVSCPADITVNASALWPCVPVDWVEPTSDDTDAQRTDRSSSPGDCFSIGITTVTYEMTDPAGNVGTCQFDVIVEDVTSPEVTYCPPSPLRYTLPLGQETAAISWTEPQAKDISGVVDVASDYQSGVSLGIGNTAITYTFTDHSGNEAKCEFMVLLTESSSVNPELLILTCPEPIIIATDGSEETVTWDVPTTNQLGLTHEYASHNPGSQFPIGVTRVTYIFNDGSTGDSATCSFTVAVVDSSPPIVESCQTSLNVLPDRSGMTARRQWEEATATDGSGLVQRTLRTSSPGDIFSANPDRDVPYPITYVFSDPSGNTATCEFVLTVLAPEQVDTMLDIVNCPSDIVTYTLETDDDAMVSWTEPRSTDPIASWDRTHSPGSYFPIGTTAVQYTFLDKEGREFFCSFDVVVEDIVPPRIINCPLGFNVTTSSSSVDKFWTDPTAMDNSGEVPTLTAPSDELLPVGINTISYRFEDGSMNEAQCQFIVNVRASSDNTPPEVQDCPSDIEVAATEGSATVTWTEPSSMESDVTIVSSHTSGDLFSIGVTMVTYLLTDADGNDNICSFSVTVLDETMPSVTCIDDVTFDMHSSESGAHVYWSEPSATDNSGIVSVTRTNASGDIFSPGAAGILYKFTDPAGNVGVCGFTVTVQVVPNTGAPQFLSCPADLYTVADSTTGVATVMWELPLVGDDTDQSPMVDASHSPSDSFPIGRTTVRYTAVNSDGNMAAPCTFYVTVHDITIPTVVNCPSTITRRLEYGVSSVPVSWEEPVAVDNGGPINGISSRISGDIFYAGVSTVEYLFSDDSGNRVSCNFRVVIEPVIDIEPPVIISCPEGPVEFDAPPTSNKAVVTWAGVNATDELTSITKSSSHLPGSEFVIGQHEVNIRFTDQPGNVADCNFIVVVSDVTTPVIENCPGVVLRIINTGASSAPVTWTTPTVTDNSGAFFLIDDNMPSPGDDFQTGITPVVYEYSDDSNNTETCEIFVTLIDDSRLPIIQHCPSAGIIKSVPENTTEVVVRWRTPTAQDPDTNVTAASSHISGDMFNLGVQEVVYAFEDFSGNVAICVFNVTVTDEYLGPTTPQIAFMDCPMEVSISSPANSSCAAASWMEPSNNSDIIVLQNQTHHPGDIFCLGQPTQVVYTFYDFVYEKLFTCSFMVFVHDVTPPVILNCPDDIEDTKDRGDGDLAVMWTPPTAMDNSGGSDLLVGASHLPGQEFGVGTTTVVYTFKDSSNISDICQFTVTISDGTLLLGLLVSEVVAISAGALVAILILIICCCCCIICCCCGSKKEDKPSSKKRPVSGGQTSETESQIDGGEIEDPHQYWVLPAPVRRVSRRVTKSFRGVRDRYSGRWGRDEREMSELNLRGDEEERVPTLERQVIKINDEDLYRL